MSNSNRTGFHKKTIVFSCMLEKRSGLFISMLRLQSTAQVSELKSWLLKAMRWTQVRIITREAVDDGMVEATLSLR